MTNIMNTSAYRVKYIMPSLESKEQTKEKLLQEIIVWLKAKKLYKQACKDIFSLAFADPDFMLINNKK